MKNYFAALFAAVVLMSAPAHAFDDWSKTDYALQGVYTVLHVIDWGQTVRIANSQLQYTSKTYNGEVYHPSSYYNTSEQNTILGKRPSAGKVNTYFASTLILHAAVSYVLPKPYRTIWQGSTIGLEAYCVGHNYYTGVKGVF